MTDEEWRASTEPLAMLDHLIERGASSGRKARLFAAAACRRIWELIPDGPGREAVGVAEAFADGAASLRRLEQAYRAAQQAISAMGMQAAALVGLPSTHQVTARSLRAAGWTAWPCADVKYAAHGRPDCVAGMAANAVRVAGAAGTPTIESWDRHREKPAQAALIRDVFGSPPCQGMTARPAWLGWDGGLIASLARAAYEERQLPSGLLDPARLVVLADALEEACAEAELVAHLREPGPHVRGCWALDFVLGKE
jgi:hypothetical protein